jgi:hypothetical protein
MAQPQTAVSVASRIDRLNVAAALHQFEKALNRSAWGSMAWGAFSILIGAFLVSKNPRVGWINLVAGGLLMVEGLYEKRVREPQVIKVSAATLGLLGLWNLAGFVMAMTAHSRFAGHPWIAVAQLIGAWNTYASYSRYAALVAASDPGTKMELQTMLDQLLAADPATTPEMVEFTSHKFGKNDIRWRARRVDDLLLFRGNEVVLGRKNSKVECFFVPRQEVKLELTGEKGLSRKQKATITAGNVQFKTTIAPEVAQKFITLVG